MDEIVTYTNDVLTNYFLTLKTLGYKSYKDVYKMLVLVYIQELVRGKSTNFITAEDYQTIDRTLHTLYGSSTLLPYYLFSNKVSDYNVEWDALIARIRLLETEDFMRLLEESDVLLVKLKLLE